MQVVNETYITNNSDVSIDTCGQGPSAVGNERQKNDSVHHGIEYRLERSRKDIHYVLYLWLQPSPQKPPSRRGVVALFVFASRKGCLRRCVVYSKLPKVTQGRATPTRLLFYQGQYRIILLGFWDQHTACELLFWQQATSCWQFFFRKSVRPAAPITKTESGLAIHLD